MGKSELGVGLLHPPACRTLRIGIDQQDAMCLSKYIGQIDGCSGFTHPTFTVQHDEDFG
jgi:hypothetical protein